MRELRLCPGTAHSRQRIDKQAAPWHERVFFFFPAPFCVRRKRPETLRRQLPRLLQSASEAAADWGRSHSPGRARRSTGACLARQAAAALSRRQARSWRLLAAGQPTTHCTSGAPSPGRLRRARVAGRAGRGAGAGCRGTEDNQPLRPPSRQLRVPCDLAPACRNPGDGPTSPSERGDDRCVAAQGLAIGRCPIHNEVEAATVVGPDVRRCGARQPLLRHDPTLRTDCLASDLDPRPLHDESASRQQTRAGAGEVVVSTRIDLAPTTISACRSTARVREGQGQAKAAPHCDVREVRCEGGRRIRRYRG